MFTQTEFDDLAVHDLVEAGPLFKGLDPKEQVTLVVLERTEEQVAFAVSYAGISLGSWTASWKKGKLTWRMA